MALTKRKEEIGNLGTSAHKHRSTLSHYDDETIKYMLNIALTALFISYLMYASSFEHTRMLVTVPFVTYCLFRYLHIIRNNNGAGERAERILLDQPMLISLIGWVISVAVILTWWK